MKHSLNGLCELLASEVVVSGVVVSEVVVSGVVVSEFVVSGVVGIIEVYPDTFNINWQYMI